MTEMIYRRIVLVNPFPYYARGINEATVYPPLGLITIAAYLKQFGVSVKVIDANIMEMRNDAVMEIIRNFGADVVGVQMNIVTARAGIELCNAAKDAGLPVVVGGPFIGETVEQLLKDTRADCMVRGEGEITFLEFCRGKKLEDIDGVAYLNNGKVVQNPARTLIENLDDLPFPDFSLLPTLRLYHSRSRNVPMAPMFTSRGCPYQCTFCSSSSKKSVFGPRFRVRSPENVVAEIEHLVKDFGVKEIDVLDDNFTLDMERTHRIFDLLLDKKIRVSINLQNGVRADRLTYDLVKKMAAAGVYKMGIGIESGNTGVLKAIKKGLDLRAVENAVKWAKACGIVIIGFFMIGFPDDTPETIRETIDFAIRLNPSIANFSLVMPFPGTELYDDVVSKGYLTSSVAQGSTSGFYGAEFHYQTPHLTKEQVLRYHRMAYKKFNFRPMKMLEIVRDIKSVHELKWTIRAARPLLQNMLKAN